MPSLPTYFFSYARRDDDNATMLQFFADLQRTLEERTPDLPDGEHLGTHDQRVDQGADWDRVLSLSLRKNKVLVAITTPHYFRRENCGKEIAVFARRHPAIEVDSDGCLRDATNILHIRWLDDAAYEHNKVKDALVHPVLKKVNWAPPQGGGDGRIRAVRRYREKGMALCVKPNREYYIELLRAFAQGIKEMPDLAEASFPVTWRDVQSAFEQGWTDGWHGPAAAGAAPAGAGPAVGDPPLPTGPGDAAVFYVTPRPLGFEPRPAAFADRLVDNPGQQPAETQEPFTAVVRAVQQATQFERLNDFHCACEPQIPTEPARLIGQLAALSARNVLVALIVDPVLWFGKDPAGAAARTAIDQVMKSNRWGGPAVLPILDDADRALKAADLLAARAVARDVTLLPDGPDAMVATLRSVLIRERGRIMRAVPPLAPARDERPPLLQGPGGEHRGR